MRLARRFVLVAAAALAWFVVAVPVIPSEGETSNIRRRAIHIRTDLETLFVR